jgi:hypothetical protein
VAKRSQEKSKKLKVVKEQELQVKDQRIKEEL